MAILEATKSREQNIKIQAEWSARSWCLTISRTLNILSDAKAVKLLDLHSGAEGAGEVETQQADAEIMFRLVVTSASQRAWSMSICDMAPRNFAGVLGPKPQASMDRMQADCEIVMKAVRLAADNDCEDQQAEHSALKARKPMQRYV